LSSKGSFYSLRPGGFFGSANSSLCAIFPAEMLRVDLNCDMGESFGAWTMGSDAELMNHVTSVNIACGFHAGDASTIRKTVELAVKKGVAIGAHPSYPDLQGFGRRNMEISSQEVFDIVLYQIAALKGITESLGGRLDHVKPHGALYNRAAKDAATAAAIARAVLNLDPTLLLVGLSGSTSIVEAERLGLMASSEAFADRTYQADGTLTPRTEPNALINDPEAAASQAVTMVRDRSVTAISGERIAIKADTICIHGDSVGAVAFAQRIRAELESGRITVAPISLHSQ
jgi:UPF0271 protein